MFRFVMPDPELPRTELLQQLRAQFEAFLCSDALREIFALLKVDRSAFSRIFNSRLLPDGRICETITEALAARKEREKADGSDA